jgi:uncharacterized protein YgbK (DUF1537 family)
VLAGSAGWARELAALLVSNPRPLPPGAPCGRVLVVAGSRSAITSAQVRLLRERGIAAEAALDPRRVDGAWSDQHAEASGAMACEALVRGTAPGASAAGEILLVTLGADDGADAERFQLRSARLNRTLGELIRAVLRRWPDTGLVLTGGDVAAAAIDALGVAGIALGAEIVPGMPMGRLSGGAAPGAPIVTKAGAFGAPDALLLAARALLEG